MRFRKLQIVGLLAVAILSGHSGMVRASETPDAVKSQTGRPIFVLNVTGVDRLLQLSDATLKLADRGELSLALRAAISLPTGGLKGIDRKRPFGVMICIDRGEVPDPVAVYYVPVSNEADFAAMLKTAAAARPVTIDKTRLLEIQVAGSKWLVRLDGGYAFIAARAKSLKRRFPNPPADFKRLSRRHDIAMRFQLDATPTGMKTMILDYLRASVANHADRGAAESASDYRYRTVVAKTTLDGLEQTLKEGKSLTIGLRVKPDTASAQFDAELIAKPGTRMERGFNGLRAAKAVGSPTNPDKPHLRLDVVPDEHWKPLVAVLLEKTVRPLQNSDPVRASILQLAGFTWSSGLQLMLWQSTSGPRETPVVFGKLTTPRSSTAAVKKLLRELQQTGRIVSLKSQVDPKARLTWHRLKWKRNSRGDTLAATLGVNSTGVWIAAGTGDLKAAVSQRIQADRQRNRKPVKPGERTLLSARVRLSELPSLFAPAKRANVEPQRDGICLAVQLRGAKLAASTTLESDVLAALLKRMMSTAARRIPALRRQQ